MELPPSVSRHLHRTLTGEKTRVTMTYVVGGYVRAGADRLAPKVDEVLALQILNLKTFAETAPVKTGKPERSPPPGR